MKAEFDIIIIGAGIGGIICAKYAQDAGLSAIVLEKAPDTGGLWRVLPAWQDIQIRWQDWTFKNIPIDGVRQEDILKNIRAWVEQFQLQDKIRTNTEVLSAEYGNGVWLVRTTAGEMRSRYLIAATGAHNQAYIPEVSRKNSTIREIHSAQLMDPEILRGRRVCVVGGAASSYDVLDLCFQYGASDVHWIYRNLNWMNPTRRNKQEATGMRAFAQKQMLGFSAEKMSAALNGILRKKYVRYGLEDIIPSYPLDLNKHHLVPGRATMIQNYQRIRRYPGTVLELNGNCVIPSFGKMFEADILVWCTGYETNLSYLKLPMLDGLKTSPEISKRCGQLFRSLDYPTLYLFGMTTLNANGSAPWAYAHAARSIMAEIQGADIFQLRPSPKNVNYFDLVKMLAKRDRKNYMRFFWYIKYFIYAFFYGKDKPLPLP